MPTYEYRCTACKNDFELFQRMSDEVGAPCPECGSPAERRLSGGAGLLFKGSGFYITENRSEGYKEAEKKEKLEPWNKPGAIPESKAPAKEKPAEAKPAQAKAPPPPKDD